jgi:hypothetical protein
MTEDLCRLAPEKNVVSPRVALSILGVRSDDPAHLLETLPFLGGDATAGVENELQAVVVGTKADVDLPLTIRASNYFANGVKRCAAGTIGRQGIRQLERYLDHNTDGVWENSWVRFPRRVLNAFAHDVLDIDQLADKAHPGQGRRSDVGRFHFHDRGEAWIRVPISYLMKLALADVLGGDPGASPTVQRAGRRLLDHFSNDNTSPEIQSFYVIPLRIEGGMGKAVARETAKRFLLTQLLIMYANLKFELAAHGQHAMVYFAPHPPVRQRVLNDCVSDAFYRDLFMSPCLSGWDRGEAKQQYMHMCHQVLSRSQLNALAKLREAGIITNDLVVLPNTSNISLANNGTHVSLGSAMLSRIQGQAASGFTLAHEKVLGDLTIKLFEHFLPLFVGTYSAAPYRLAFSDFHPERVLGFLPHELDYTHLRMLWRRWRKKAKLRVFGRPLTPFGPRWIDDLLATVFRLRGDLVTDFRLLDYLVALMSTDQSPGLDGRLGNWDRLKADLAALGVFDARMAMYLPYRLREYGRVGFSGFEGRYYSQFEGFAQDLGRAVDLQLLVTALAFKYMAEGRLDHADIPDDPTLESERRQVFFGAAIGLPTFFVHVNTRNRFLQAVLARTKRVRASRRHAGYLRVRTQEYQRGLLRLLRSDATDLAEVLGLESALDDLALRLEYPEERSVASRLTRGILAKAGAASPLALEAPDFNLCAESYYRDDLRRRHVEEALQLLAEDLQTLEDRAASDGYVSALRSVAGEGGATAFLARVRDDVLHERVTLEGLRRLTALVVLSIHHDNREAEALTHAPRRLADTAAPIHRAA